MFKHLLKHLFTFIS